MRLKHCPQNQQLLPLLLLFQGFPPLQYHFIQFVHTLVEPLTYYSTCRLDVVGGGWGELVQSQLLLNICHWKRFGQVLLVGDDQQRRALVLGKLGDFVQFSLGLLQPVNIHRVHNINDPICASAVGLPQGPQLLLAPHVPEMTADALRGTVTELDLLSVEPDRGNSVDKFIEFESVKDCGLPSRVQTQHDDVKRLEGRDVGEAVAHFGVFSPLHLLEGFIHHLSLEINPLLCSDPLGNSWFEGVKVEAEGVRRPRCTLDD